jgi:hypothetical protein
MFRFHRVLIAYAVAVPLALILGYLVATPDMTSIATLAFVLFFLALPLLIQWNHGLLIFFWNSAFIAGFLPGQLPLWFVFAGLTLGMGVVHFVMGNRNFLRAPELTKPILFLVAVVVVTAKIRGGLGLRAMGSESYGGKRYVYLMAAIVGYYALISQPIPCKKAFRAVAGYLLPALTFGMTNFVYLLGPSFYVLYYFLSPDFVYGQAGADWTPDVVKRLTGLGPAGSFLLCFILARWGVRGIFDFTKPWRMFWFAAAFTAGLFSGFRSQITFMGALFVVQFMVEGLWRTRLLPILALLGVLGLTPLLFFANKMPMAVQRTLAFLPINIDYNARADAKGSSEWRYEMWRVVWPEVPRYLWLGKGYAIDPVDLYLTGEASRMGILSNYEGAILAGDYHNGPLSVLMPFGIFGAIAFLWLLGAGIKVLYCNCSYGDPRLKSINSLFLAYFLTQCLFFFFVFGALSSQLSAFLGILGLSISLNAGVCRKRAAKAASAPASAAAMLQPA